MGAKNHAVVMPDANVEATTSALVSWQGGQSCVSVHCAVAHQTPCHAGGIRTHTHY